LETYAAIMYSLGNDNATSGCTFIRTNSHLDPPSLDDQKVYDESIQNVDPCLVSSKTYTLISLFYMQSLSLVYPCQAMP